MKVGINGFGRMGRLALRAAWQHPDLDFVAINEPHASADNLALLLEFDSVQGRWDRPVRASDGALQIDGQSLPVQSVSQPGDCDWSGVDLVLECSGKFRTQESLRGHFDRGAQRVVVSAPVKGGVPNIVVGVNHQSFDLGEHRAVTAASCTTNCLAPIARVLHDGLGIERGAVTTLHDPTNTQSVHDRPLKDPRRARASLTNLIPTSTNSATAVTEIIPELLGKLDSTAVRVPVLNASMVDFVFQASRDTTVDEVNGLLEAASAAGPLQGILGYETRPLVSCDYARDARSGIVDSTLTRVIDGRMVKVMAWYDNEWGYANRLVELAAMVANARG